MYSEKGLLKLNIEESELLVNVNFDQDKKYYVYAYLDPRVNKIYLAGDYAFVNKPFYIGKGTKQRMYSHINEAIKTNKKSYKLNKIRKILKCGYEPIIVRITELIREEEALYIEYVLLHELKGYKILTNIKDGYNTDYKFINKELFSKIVSNAGKESYKNNPDRGRNHSKKVSGNKNGRFGKGYMTSGDKNGNYINVDTNKIVELYELTFNCNQIAKIFGNISCIVPKSRLKKLNKIRKTGLRSNMLDFTNRDSLIKQFLTGEISYEQLINNRKKFIANK